MTLLGTIMLFFGGDWLVAGASWVARRYGVSKLVVGLTLVAFGTSAPELAVSVYSVLKGEPDIAVGNVVGSNIVNILLVLGASALVHPIQVGSSLLRSDLPFLMVVSLLSFFLAFDGSIGRFEGLFLFLLLVGYLFRLFYKASKLGEVSEVIDLDEIDEAEVGSDESAIKEISKLIGGVVILIVGSKFFIDGATQMAHNFGVSDAVIGLSVVALGTSLPEVAASVVAAFRGQSAIALGNVIGSNIFNLLAVMGITSMISKVGVEVSSEILTQDFPLMILITALCFPLLITGNIVSRVEGGFLLLSYGVYLAYIFGFIAIG
ncbi:calcium/sodium antiporter [bacterium]|nr:calcium/sodium antiporter [bacterium]